MTWIIFLVITILGESNYKIKISRMKNTITILIGFLLFSSTLFSQSTFSVQIYLNAKSLVRTLDNKCILLTGYGGTFCETDTSTGFVYWKSEINYQGQSFFVRDIIQTSDSNYVAIICQIGPSYFISALKITASGTLLWVKKYTATATNNAWDLTQTPDGGFIMVGGGCSATNFVIRCDSWGNIVWQKQYKDLTVSDGTAFNICYASNDTYYIAGKDDANNIVFKIDGSGNLLWFRKILMNGNDYNGGLITSNDGGVTLAGNTRVLDSNVVSSYLAHFDSSGNNLWLKVYTAGGIVNRSNNLIQMDDGNYIITGVAFFNDIRNNQMLNFKTDMNGNFIWAKTAGGSSDGAGYDDSFCIQELSNSSFLVCGNKNFSKLNTNGNGWCYPDTLGMLSIIPPFAINTSISPWVFNSYFISDTIAYTYNLTPGFSAYTCNNVTETESESVFDEDISIYPNPFSNKLEFQIRQNEPSEVSIYDITGQKILEHKFIKSASLNTEQLAKGLYIYEVHSDNGYCKKGKLFKN